MNTAPTLAQNDMGENCHVVMSSGGIGSYAAARRTADKYGTDNLTLLFTDVIIESGDLYRFLVETSCNIFSRPAPEDLLSWWRTVPEYHQDPGARAAALVTLREEMRDIVPELVWLADGRSPWQVFADKRFLGNARRDPCSDILKRKLADRWLIANCNPLNTIVHVGIDWTEEHRYIRLGGLRALEGWRYEAPMCDAPFIMKDAMFALLALEGIRPPLLYGQGFSHNNCGGFCIKAGIGHFVMLFHVNPELYAFCEQEEQRIIALIGKPVGILTDRRGGKRVPMTMRQLRERIEAGEKFDRFDLGGCGCFSGTEDDEQ